ncbi:SsgA family sporulation/cell division regulator [Streptomyces griseomycini]|uniref:SsgA family sporulation/cell division regulator n=1 Tax=Streptomyces griseomycini TaxID=66895 RepID=UPI00343D4EBF
MIVRKEAEDNFAETEDDDFDALLNASSLGAPHVLAEDAPIPADMHRRLSQAAARPARHETEPAAQKETDCAPGASRSSLLLQLDASRTHFDDALSRLRREPPLLVLWCTLGSGKTASALHWLCNLADEDRAAWSVKAPTQPQRLLQRALPKRDHFIWEPQTSSVTGGRAPAAWYVGRGMPQDDLTTTLPHPSCITTSPRAQLPLYVLDDLPFLQVPAPQCSVRPARMTELLTLWETIPGCAASPRPESWRGLRQAKVPLPGFSPGPARHSQGRLMWTGPWCRHLFVPRSSLVLATQCTGVLTGALELRTLHKQPVVSLRSHADRLLSHWFSPMPLSAACGLMATDGMFFSSHLYARWCPVEDHSVHRIPAVSGSLLFESYTFGSGWPAPQRCEPDAVARPALRMWTEHGEEGTTEHAVLKMTMHQESGGGVQVPVRLTYRSADPYAVEAVFHPDDPGNEITWSFARDLLLEGLEYHAGEGDVTVWSPPALRGKHEERRTLIRLSSPEGTALLSASRTQLKKYLDKTLLLVAVGTECERFGSALDRLERKLGELTCPGFND